MLFRSSEPKEIELDAKPPKEIDHNSIWEDIKEGTVERTKKLGEALTDYKGERGFFQGITHQVTGAVAAAGDLITGAAQIAGGAANVLVDQSKRVWDDPAYQTNRLLSLGNKWNEPIPEIREAFEHGMQVIPSFSDIIGKMSGLVYGKEADGVADYLRESIPEKTLNWTSETLDKVAHWVAGKFSDKPDVLNTFVYSTVSAAEFLFLAKAHQAAKMKLNAMGENKAAAAQEMKRVDKGYDSQQTQQAAILERLERQTPPQSVSTESKIGRAHV